MQCVVSPHRSPWCILANAAYNARLPAQVRFSVAVSPTAIMFVNPSGMPATFVAPGGYTFWSLLNQVIQDEPFSGFDPTT